MADYYSQFSTLIPCRTQEEFDWLIKALSPIDVDSLEEDEEYDEDDQCAACLFEREDKGLWIYSDESFQIERTMYALAEFQTKFSITDTWVIEWAFTCSKPVLDSFSGGGCVIKDGEVHFCDVSNKLHEIKSKLNKPLVILEVAQDDFKKLKDGLQAVYKSCEEGYDETWDCSSVEGREGFLAMQEELAKAAKMLGIDLK